MSDVCGRRRLAKLAFVIGASGNLRGFLEEPQDRSGPSDFRLADPFAFHAAFLEVPSAVNDGSAPVGSLSGFLQAQPPQPESIVQAQVAGGIQKAQAILDKFAQPREGYSALSSEMKMIILSGWLSAPHIDLLTWPDSLPRSLEQAAKEEEDEDIPNLNFVDDGLPKSFIVQMEQAEGAAQLAGDLQKAQAILGTCALQKAQAILDTFVKGYGSSGRWLYTFSSTLPSTPANLQEAQAILDTFAKGYPSLSREMKMRILNDWLNAPHINLLTWPGNLPKSLKDAAKAEVEMSSVQSDA